MEELAFVIDWALRIFGLLSIVGIFVAFFRPSIEYCSNIVIKKVTDDELNDLNLHYYEIFEHEKIEYAEKYIIMPVDTDFKKVELYELEYLAKKNKLKSKKMLHCFYNVVNTQGVLIETLVPEGIPNLKVIWTTNEGLIGEYIFRYNRFNGCEGIKSYKYRTPFLLKLKVFLGI